MSTPELLDPDTRAAVEALVADVARADGRNPLSDQALTHLGARTVRHAVARDGGEVVGYAQLDGNSLEIAARTDAIEPLLDTFGDTPALIWSHGRRSRLTRVLEQRGLHKTRELHQLRRSLDEPVEVPEAPAGVDIRPFAPGEDEDSWVAVNSAAFAHHPEQGSWSRADLEAREAEAWFDPAGFLMAWRDGSLAGFHWTKVHENGDGEVYVLAVAPSAQGLGLGAVLLEHGLAHLWHRGCRDVLLYVDGDNTGAMHLYERNGFRPHDLDLQWTADGSAQSSGTVSNT